MEQLKAQQRANIRIGISIQIQNFILRSWNYKGRGNLNLDYFSLIVLESASYRPLYMNSVTDCAFGFTSCKDWQMRDEKIRYQLPIAE